MRLHLQSLSFIGTFGNSRRGVQVGDLRLALQRAEQQQARKEDYLREEISELQQVSAAVVWALVPPTPALPRRGLFFPVHPQRLQEAESRNQELSESVTSATRPLLRQIENLQASLGGQTASWEKLEQSISDRLGKSPMFFRPCSSCGCCESAIDVEMPCIVLFCCLRLSPNVS